MKTVLSSLLLLLLPVVASAQETAAEIEALLRKTDDVARGDSSIATMEMHVKTASYERTMKMKAWAQGTDRTLVRILEPAKDAGIATLKVDENLWNYLPKVDRTMKIPSGMMGGSWMGSHFTNDDLVQESRLSEDFTWTVDARPSGGEGQWTIALVPKPEAPVVWGKVVVEIRADELPIRTTYYDEKGKVVRTMAFEDYAAMDGRTVPRVMRLTPADKPGEFTEMRYVELDFGADIPTSTFTLQALK
ncbi:MAG: outer membrane lipoprotein-sorting protein [Alphaproteobacteria bacterium]|nr:outer membrane lipoprotein-sorting protein [Alphaproteobacteria bacterium]